METNGFFCCCLSTEAPLVLPFCRGVAAAGVVSSVCSSFCPCSACFETKPWWLSGWDPSSQRAALSWGRRVEGWHCNKSSRYGAVFRWGLSGRGLFSQVACAHEVEAQADVLKWALLQEKRNRKKLLLNAKRSHIMLGMREDYKYILSRNLLG